MIGRVTALAAVFANTAASAAEPLQPTAKWVVNFDAAQCVASRNYGTADKPVFLVLKAPPIGDVLQIGIIRNGRRSEPTQAEGEIVFGNFPPVKTSLLEYGVKSTGQRALFANIPTSELAPFGQAATLRIKARGVSFSDIRSRIPVGSGSYEDETFALTQMPALLKILDDCAADLGKVWNVWSDDSPSPVLKEGPKPDLSKIFDSEDYPAVALLKNQAGTVALVLLVDEQGSVADCTTVSTSGVAALDAQSCAIVMARGKFKPAIGLDGKPSKSAYSQRIRWTLQ